MKPVCLTGFPTSVSILAVVLVTADGSIDKVIQNSEQRDGRGFVFVALGLGIETFKLFGGPDADTRRRVMALGTSQRNIGAAVVVAGRKFQQPEVVW